jgi:hypothetical protein
MEKIGIDHKLSHGLSGIAAMSSNHRLGEIDLSGRRIDSRLHQGAATRRLCTDRTTVNRYPKIMKSLASRYCWL